MKPKGAKGSLLLVLLVLAGCASVPNGKPAAMGDPLAAQELRERQLAQVTPWSFRGRLAISQGEEGGSGRLEWRQDGEDFDIRLSAPVTGQGWRLARTAGVVRLTGLEGGERVGSDAQAMLREATGWTLPLVAMGHWVRGLRHDPAAAELEFAPDARPVLLREQGWTVEFRAWDGQDLSLPTRLHARQGEASVRLAIDGWDSP